MGKTLGPSPPPTSEAVSKSMRSNRPKNTQPELMLRRSLWELGVRGYRIHRKDIPGRPDVAFPGKRLAVFVNGCFWHRCPKCRLPVPRTHGDFWAEKFRRNVQRDARKKDALESVGWKVLVVWECDIRRDPRRVASDIRRMLDRM